MGNWKSGMKEDEFNQLIISVLSVFSLFFLKKVDKKFGDGV